MWGTRHLFCGEGSERPVEPRKKLRLHGEPLPPTNHRFMGTFRKAWSELDKRSSIGGLNRPPKPGAPYLARFSRDVGTTSLSPFSLRRYPNRKKVDHLL